MVSVTHKSDPDHPEMVQAGQPARKDGCRTSIYEPGDTVIVARGGVAYIVGDVCEAGRLPDRRQRPVDRAAGHRAGGGNDADTSSQDKAQLIRKTPKRQRRNSDSAEGHDARQGDRYADWRTEIFSSFRPARARSSLIAESTPPWGLRPASHWRAASSPPRMQSVLENAPWRNAPGNALEREGPDGRRTS